MKEYKYILNSARNTPQVRRINCAQSAEIKKWVIHSVVLFVGMCIPLHRMAFATNVVEHTLWILLTLLHF